MKTLCSTLAVFMALVLMSAPAYAQADRASASPPLSQPLVREGDFAVALADALRLGPAADEIEAERALNQGGIAPRNGWIADYPVTPDIVGELQTAVGEAADAGRLAMSRDEAFKAFQNVIIQNNLAVQMDTSGREVGDTSGAEYADPRVMNEYYYDEGPPVVTYYAPPPDYSYLYTWVPYPFWWWNFWFPGFFILTDFHVRVHDHDHGHGHGHGEHERGHGEFVSNHHRDPGSGRMSRVDPTNRSRGGTLPPGDRKRWTSPSAQSGAQSIIRRAPSGRTADVTTGRTPAVATGRTPAVTTGQEYRGYGSPRSSVGTRSSVFDRSGNSRVERSSGDRGVQSRTNAGQSPSRSSVSGGAGRGGAAGGSYSGGGGARSGGDGGAGGVRGGGSGGGGGRR